MEQNLRPGIGIIYNQELFKRDVRGDVNKCALFLLIYYGVYFLAVFIVQIFAAALDPAFLQAVISAAGGQDLSGAAAEAAEMSGNINGLMSIISIAAGGCVFLIPRKKRFFTDIARPMSEPLTPKIFIILIAATQAIQFIWGWVVVFIDFLLPESLSLAGNYSEAMETLYTPVGMLYIVLIGPVFEELIFRGAVMGMLERFGENFAILFSSLFFGFYHMIFLQIPFGFFMGLLLGYAASRWSLRTSIALHIIVNGLSMLFSLVSADSIVVAIGGYFTLVCTAAAVILVIARRKQLKARLRLSAAYYPKTYAHGFSAIAFWIFIIIMVAGGLLQLIFL